jgi:hypothetical protein
MKQNKDSKITDNQRKFNAKKSVCTATLMTLSLSMWKLIAEFASRPLSQLMARLLLA